MIESVENMNFGKKRRASQCPFKKPLQGVCVAREVLQQRPLYRRLVVGMCLLPRRGALRRRCLLRRTAVGELGERAARVSTRA